MAHQQPDLLLTSSQASQQWSACFWDYTSGNSIQTYKNGAVAALKTLNVISNDYVLTAECTKPLLHVWPVNNQEQLKNLRLVLPESANVVTVCPNNSYLAAGIGSKLYVWQIATGRLLCVQQKHLQPITCIAFIDSDYLITAGQDGILLVYNLGCLVSLQSNILPQTEIGQTEPLHAKSDHSLPITDIHVGNFGANSRMATVSADQTCKIYRLIDGQLLLTVVFTEPLTSVTFDVACWFLYIGTNSGNLLQFTLKNPPRTIEYHVRNEDSNANHFVGHSKKINCVSLNIAGTILASGSDDCQVLIWEIRSQQILRKLEHKGAVTNVMFVLKHENIFAQQFKPQHVLKALQRNLDFEDTNFVIPVVQTEDIEFSDDEIEGSSATTVNEQIVSLESELTRANVINKQLYDGMIKLIKKYNNVE